MPGPACSWLGNFRKIPRLGPSICATRGEHSTSSAYVASRVPRGSPAAGRAAADRSCGLSPDAPSLVPRVQPLPMWRQLQASFLAHFIASREKALAKRAPDVRYQSTLRLEQHVSHEFLRRQVGRLRPVQVRIIKGRRSEYDRVDFGPYAG